MPPPSPDFLARDIWVVYENGDFLGLFFTYEAAARTAKARADKGAHRIGHYTFFVEVVNYVPPPSSAG